MQLIDYLAIIAAFFFISPWICFAFGYGFLGVALFYVGLAILLLGGDYLDYIKIKRKHHG